MPGFKNGFCICCNDFGITVIAYCAPAIIVGKNAEQVGDNCLIYGCLGTSCIGVFIRAMIREKIRKKFGIPGSLCKDLCLHWYCCYCSLIQEAHILRSNDCSNEVHSNMHIVRE
ncbi:uncharacterized protein LOC101236691 [Hydra vulgaris]|uniref:uncharacterized protein LOC101236691 n=1 Tax=Hydra vulgaris TaxID=6087 RepID=UPI001F5E6499|nr:protein PLANT CADMIUM RESISTANCE 4 [Hydra vulgaris]